MKKRDEKRKTFLLELELFFFSDELI